MNSPSKQLYRKESPNLLGLTVFQEPWWLDVVAGGKWDVVVHRMDDEIVAALPYACKKHMGKTIIYQPKLTQHIGPWWRAKCGQVDLDEEHRIMSDLFSRLPLASNLTIAMSTCYQNWLPMYWMGYRQTTFYTYRIPELSNLDTVWASLHDSVKRNVRKARDRIGLSVGEDLHMEQFIDLHEAVFRRQKQPQRFKREFLRELDEACKARDRRRIFHAYDSQGNLHAAVYLVWDSTCAYYLMSGTNPACRSSGALSLCMWRAIEFASSKVRVFDFEGSMVPGIEKYFRSFGTVQIPYFRLSKGSSMFWDLADFFRERWISRQRAKLYSRNRA